jgi:CHAT domain-containing protein
LNGDDFKNYPFLINRYNVSYSYSANLFYRTFPKDKQKKPELTNINDWLALAPIFDDKSEQGVMLATRELQRQLSNLKSDTMNVRGRMLSGDYITPLPGTESETQAIIKQYENRNLKAQALLHQSANEQFIKSGGLEKYKVLHFATHGFVNSEKPELSGILLAQDSTGNQDGVLYSGEIYNLKLNADLVVLSACETGLGKINKGEGIIGLTRALLYAGSKNIIVSLWQVSDESTSDLMIDFYNNLLNTKNKSYGDPLRKAKLKMISEGKFAHPFYWSPFILVGK